MTVGLALMGVALVTGIWGAGPAPFAAPGLDRPATTTSAARASRTTASSRSASPAVLLVGLLAPAVHPLRADHPRRCREPHDGAGARHRRATTFTLVFAIGGAAAALGGVLAGSTSARLARQGTSLLIYAFIVVVIGGFGSIVGTAVAALWSGSCSSSRTTTVLAASATFGRPAARRDAAHPARRPLREMEWRIEALRRHRPRGRRLRRAGARPQISVGTHGVFSSPLDSPGTLQLLGLMLSSADRALVRLAVRLHGTALVRPRAVRGGRRLHHRDRDVEWDWGLWPTLGMVAARRPAGAARARRGQPAGRRDRLRDGHARVRPRRARRSSTRTRAMDRRRGGREVDFDNLPTWMVGVFNTKYLYWIALGYLIAVFVIVAGPSTRRRAASGRRSARTSSASSVLGMRPFRHKLMAFVLALVPRDRRRRRLRAADQTRADPA